MNRQVPEKIAIIGNGKVARHMIRYFELLGQPYIHWFRNQSKLIQTSNQSRLAQFKRKLKHLFPGSTVTSLEGSVVSANKVLLLIPDDQIETFIDANPCLKNKTLIHFSGSLNLNKAIGCHPLMTFGHDLYDLQQYQAIPFVVDESIEFHSAFPLFKNPVHRIKPEHKARYHAMCVMAGNFSQILWQATTAEMVRMGLPADLMHRYLKQNTENYIKDPKNALTGPLVRGDAKTIEQHLQALAEHPLGDIYQSFSELYEQPMTDARRRQQ